MLLRFDHLRGYSLRATDGSLGSVTDLLFDDQSWTVRWLVVDTAWLFGRRVLLAPEALGQPDDAARELPVNLTKDRIKNAPDVDTEKPVSRQHETSLYAYYGWAPYWGVGGWAAPILPAPGVPYPAAGGAPGAASREAAELQAAQHDSHLRSGREVTGYHIRATDDSVGHVQDLLIDTDAWAIRYVLVDTRNWLPGR
ncbi:MAG: PRC-barrel domain containing protein, partial [Reyranellaceae bacterium]